MKDEISSGVALASANLTATWKEVGWETERLHQSALHQPAGQICLRKLEIVFSEKVLLAQDSHH